MLKEIINGYSKQFKAYTNYVLKQTTSNFEEIHNEHFFEYKDDEPYVVGDYILNVENTLYQRYSIPKIRVFPEDVTKDTPINKRTFITYLFKSSEPKFLFKIGDEGIYCKDSSLYILNSLRDIKPIFRYVIVSDEIIRAVVSNKLEDKKYKKVQNLIKWLLSELQGNIDDYNTLSIVNIIYLDVLYVNDIENYLYDTQDATKSLVNSVINHCYMENNFTGIDEIAKKRLINEYRKHK